MGVEKFDQLASQVAEARKEYDEFVGGKKVAATRSRKALQEVKKLAQDIRNDIQAMRKPPAAPAAGGQA